MGDIEISLGIIIQARMGSTRLPGKILRLIGDKVLLDHVLSRLRRLKHLATIVVATSDTPQDDTVVEFCRKRSTECFRGSEANVLERYYQCAQHYNFNQIVRLTADNPFTDIEELDNLIALHLASDSDFSHSFGALPIGVGAEIFTFPALKASYREGSAPHHLEHVDEYLLEHPERFKTTLLQVSGIKNQPQLRLTVDTLEDHRKACFITQHAAREYVTTEEAIELCSRFA
ncbi:MAG TPA: glycosyltransferase family protein [Sideroxyarcus sp.]|nr:glycosyltransferase family protein [Sideroxyarcus sp.]